MLKAIPSLHPPSTKGQATPALQYLRLADLHKGGDSFNPREDEESAELLDTLFPALNTVGVYESYVSRVATWDSHWIMIEGCRKLLKQARVFSRL